MPHPREVVNSVVGRVLKGIARENDKTQQQIADYLGTNVATINRYFGGKREVTAAQFIQISEFCGEDPSKVLDRVMIKLSSMSELPANVSSLEDKRKTPAQMTDDELEAERWAANRDAEYEADEPSDT